jgi:hypothetical protein
MIAPRPFRPVPYDARGAADQLLEGARTGAVDERAVRLLIHCLRGGSGAPGSLQLARRATGYRPPDNFHGVARAA